MQSAAKCPSMAMIRSAPTRGAWRLPFAASEWWPRQANADRDPPTGDLQIEGDYRSTLASFATNGHTSMVVVRKVPSSNKRLARLVAPARHG